MCGHLRVLCGGQQQLLNDQEAGRVRWVGLSLPLLRMGSLLESELPGLLVPPGRAWLTDS